MAKRKSPPPPYEEKRGGHFTGDKQQSSHPDQGDPIYQNVGESSAPPYHLSSEYSSPGPPTQSDLGAPIHMITRTPQSSQNHTQYPPNSGHQNQMFLSAEEIQQVQSNRQNQQNWPVATQAPQPIQTIQPYQPNQHSSNVVTQPPQVTHVTVIQPVYVGSCPVCHKGDFRTYFTCTGWLCGIFCFPCGVIFCYCCMRQKRCNHCGYTVKN